MSFKVDFEDELLWFLKKSKPVQDAIIDIIKKANPTFDDLRSEFCDIIFNSNIEIIEIINHLKSLSFNSEVNDIIQKVESVDTIDIDAIAETLHKHGLLTKLLSLCSTKKDN